MLGITRQRSRKSTSKGALRCYRPRLEALEERALPSSIVWLNQGSQSSDTDNFNAVFGNNAGAARATVNEALKIWQNTIAHFNYADGTDALSLTISMSPSVPALGAGTASGLTTDGHGRPEAGQILIGEGTDGHGAGWFLDANLLDKYAFDGTLATPYARNATPSGYGYGQADLLSVVEHEVLHAVGFAYNPNLLFTENVTGYLHATGAADTANSPGTLSTYIGPDTVMLLTSNNGNSSLPGATHAAAVGDQYTDPVTHVTYYGSLDLLNPFYSFSQRKLPSLSDLLVLKDTYGYSIETPKTFESYLATGADAGGAPEVKVYDQVTGQLKYDFSPWPGFTGGVRVAIGDVNGDGIPDIIVAPGPGALPGQPGTAPPVQVYNGATGALMATLTPYPRAFLGGMFAGAGDVDGNGVADVITGADAGGGPEVVIFKEDTSQKLFDFYAYDYRFGGGVRVAIADVNHDGHGDILTGAGPGGGPNATVFSGAVANYVGGAPTTTLYNWMAFSVNFSGGIYVTAGDLNYDGYADIVTSKGPGDSPEVKAWYGAVPPPGPIGAPQVLFLDYNAYGPSFSGGVRVALADVNGDGRPDIITAPGSGFPSADLVYEWDGTSPGPVPIFLTYFTPYANWTGGVFVGGG